MLSQLGLATFTSIAIVEHAKARLLDNKRYMELCWLTEVLSAKAIIDQLTTIQFLIYICVCESI